MIKVKASAICENLIKALRRREITEGCVHSVFRGACNIETCLGLVAILGPDKESAPMSIVLESTGESVFDRLMPAISMPVVFGRDFVSCAYAGILIGLEGAHAFSPGMSGSICGSYADFARNLAVLERNIPLFCKPQGMGPLVGLLEAEMPDLGLSFECFRTEGQGAEFIGSRFLEFIGSRFLQFIGAVKSGDMAGAAGYARNMIGFGPGLTPSMDDFIAGMMIAFVYMAGYFRCDIHGIYEFNRRLAGEGQDRTTRVSAEMLRYAAKGETNQALKNLIEACLCPYDADRIVSALARAVRIGGTSGSDTVLGLYIACRIMINSEFRGEGLNESVS